MSIHETPPTSKAVWSAPAASDLFMGRYRLIRAIGYGSSGPVFEAADTALDGSRVALKLFTQKEQASPDRENRVQREGRILFSLCHPLIVQPLAIGEGSFAGDEEVYPYITLELLDGEPLSKLLERGRLSEARARKLLSQLAETLAYVHSSGYVHGDLKPSNLFLLERGDLKLLDFGITRSIAPAAEVDSIRSAIGTVSYLAPELHAGASHTTASDIYAFGLIGLEMFGFSPESGGLAHSQGAVKAALTKARGRIPEQLLEVLTMALAPDPRKRLADGAAVAMALREPAPNKRTGARAFRSFVYRFTRVSLSDLLSVPFLILFSMFWIWALWHRGPGWILTRLDNIHGVVHFNHMIRMDLIPRTAAPPFDEDKVGQCILNYFMNDGDQYGAWILLNKGYTLCSDMFTEGPVRAVENGHFRLINAFFEKGVDPFSQVDGMERFTLWSLLARHIETYRTFKKWGVRKSCLEQLSVLAQQCDISLLQEMIIAGGSLSEPMVDCDPPFGETITARELLAMAPCPAVVEFTFRSADGDPNARASGGRATLPMTLASLGEWWRLKLALDYGASPNEKQPDGDSLLKIAIESRGSALEIVRELSSYPGIDLRYRSQHDRGYLAIAAAANNIDGVVALAGKVPVDDADRARGMTALDYAVDSRLRQPYDIFYRLTFDSPLLDDEMRSAMLSIPLLAAGASADHRDASGITTLARAEDAHCRLCVELLKGVLSRHGADGSDSGRGGAHP